MDKRNNRIHNDSYFTLIKKMFEIKCTYNNKINKHVYDYTCDNLKSVNSMVHEYLGIG